jgi:hypothetical protein
MCSMSVIVMFREGRAQYICAHAFSVSPMRPHAYVEDSSGHFRHKENEIGYLGESEGPVYQSVGREFR